MFEKENTDHGNHMINAQPSFSKKRCFQHVFRPHETELGIDRGVFQFPPACSAFSRSFVSVTDWCGR